VGAAAVVDKLLAEPYRTRVYPDALGYMLLLKGAVCGFVDPRTEVWDVAPFHVILPEAGYEIAKWDGAVSLTPGAVYSYPSGRRDETLAALLLQESGSRD
jgi:fructose-1,6-bisphosphatase/inositol monophosphatase family enzyme